MKKQNYNLKGKKVAILVADGFEQDELFVPRQALEEAGAETSVVSPCEEKVEGRKHAEPGRSVRVDKSLSEVTSEQFDALLLPGGVHNPDSLRMNPGAVQFVRSFFDAHKPVAAICHGPWTLIEADVVRGRRMTSYASIKTDLRNAGAEWVDEEVVVDDGLVTSRMPDDLPAFNARMIEEFARSRDAGENPSVFASPDPSQGCVQ